LPAYVEIRESILHPTYWQGRAGEGPGYETHVCGVGTEALASRFRAGESVAALVRDYPRAGDTMAECRLLVEAALRWEMVPRRTRVAAVRAAIAEARG
jgi:hypothetical protein